MLAFDLVNFRKISSPLWPDVNTMMARYMKKVNVMEHDAEFMERSLRAKKTWATRRANGWVHPNKLIPIDDERSIRAKKAWETRRANGWIHPNCRETTLVSEIAKPQETAVLSHRQREAVEAVLLQVHGAGCRWANGTDDDASPVQSAALGGAEIIKALSSYS